MKIIKSVVNLIETFADENIDFIYANLGPKLAPSWPLLVLV
jgi:hypothetical protein